ncbi:uncharacterized protein ZBAI_04143 [Zygosaccharomyces bailii ISA1307]|nr:uncharacterized protein ZBAI_04143 [Zygosaccharomyces bailii ISA1307]
MSLFERKKGLKSNAHFPPSMLWLASCSLSLTRERASGMPLRSLPDFAEPHLSLSLATDATSRDSLSISIRAHQAQVTKFQKSCQSSKPTENKRSRPVSQYEGMYTSNKVKLSVNVSPFTNCICYS